MNVRLAALVLALAAGMSAQGCGSGLVGSPGQGGSSGGAGTTGAAGGGGAGGAPCPDVTACAGSVVGTWTVVSSCLAVSGTLDLSLVGAGCPTAPVTGSLAGTGTFPARSE